MSPKVAGLTPEWNRDTAKYAEAVSRDGFFHSGDSFSVLADGHRHARSPGPKLYALLTYTKPDGPALTKAGTVRVHKPKRHVDPPVHFYVAQLMHYGLPLLKTKAAAKKKLLAAFNEKKVIKVPEAMVVLERELFEEYSRANVVATKKYEEERKKYEEEREEWEKQRQKREKEQQRDAEKREKLRQEALAKMREKETGEERRVRQARESLDSLPYENMKGILDELIQDPTTKDAVISRIPEWAFPQTAPRKRTKPADKKTIDQEDLENLPEYLNGWYSISAPYLTEQWGDSSEAMYLRIMPSNNQSHIWGDFKMSILSGVVRSVSAPDSNSKILKFLWRGREEGENIISTGNRNTVSIAFTSGPNGITLKGFMNGDLAKFEFTGKKTTKMIGPSGKFLRKCKDEWRSLTDRMYDHENITRWGKWHEQPSKDQPEESDSTVGRPSHSDGEEDEYGDEDDSMDVDEDGDEHEYGSGRLLMAF